MKKMIKTPRVHYGLDVHDNEEIQAVTKTLNTSTQIGINVLKFEKQIGSSSSSYE